VLRADATMYTTDWFYEGATEDNLIFTRIVSDDLEIGISSASGR
jgi:hypothetical protein